MTRCEYVAYGCHKFKPIGHDPEPEELGRRELLHRQIKDWAMQGGVLFLEGRCASCRRLLFCHHLNEIEAYRRLRERDLSMEEIPPEKHHSQTR